LCQVALPLTSMATIAEEIAQMKADYNEALDTIWMLLAAMLVFFMHAGFSLLESGSVRQKNAQNILAKNLLVVTCGFLCWYFLGWPLAYGVDAEADKPSKFAGHKQIFMDGFLDIKALFRNWFFQGAFCATACTIVSGAMAERTRLTGFAIYSVIMTSWIYPVIVYWGWSGSGMLTYTGDDGETTSIIGGPGYKDFAGSGLVHLVGGVGAICGSLFVGPRKDRWAKEEEFVAHNIPFVVLGTFCLWFGWYGFNPGSTLSMHDKAAANTAGIVAVNTTLAPCAAGLVVFFLRAVVVSPRLLDVGGFCNGVLAGLVSITAGCAFVKPWETVIIGVIGGLIYQLASMMLKFFKIDDVVDAFPVHGACGIWGVVAVGLFGNPDDGLGGNGVFYGGNQLGVQLFGILMIVLWVGFFSCAIFLPLRLAKLLRLAMTSRIREQTSWSIRRKRHMPPPTKLPRILPQSPLMIQRASEVSSIRACARIFLIGGSSVVLTRGTHADSTTVKYLRVTCNVLCAKGNF